MQRKSIAIRRSRDGESGAGGKHKAALARLHSARSLNRSQGFTAGCRGSSLTPLGWRSFNARVDLETLEVDGGNYSSPGRCYLSREAWEEEKLLRAAWREFQRDVERANAEGGLITVENISAARQALGLKERSEEQKGK